MWIYIFLAALAAAIVSETEAQVETFVTGAMVTINKTRESLTRYRDIELKRTERYYIARLLKERAKAKIDAEVPARRLEGKLRRSQNQGRDVTQCRRKLTTLSDDARKKYTSQIDRCFNLHMPNFSEMNNQIRDLLLKGDDFQAKLESIIQQCQNRRRPIFCTTLDSSPLKRSIVLWKLNFERMQKAEKLASRKASREIPKCIASLGKVTKELSHIDVTIEQCISVQLVMGSSPPEMGITVRPTTNPQNSQVNGNLGAQTSPKPVERPTDHSPETPTVTEHPKPPNSPVDRPRPPNAPMDRPGPPNPPMDRPTPPDRTIDRPDPTSHGDGKPLQNVAGSSTEAPGFAKDTEQTRPSMDLDGTKDQKSDNSVKTLAGNADGVPKPQEDTKSPPMNMIESGNEPGREPVPNTGDSTETVGSIGSIAQPRPPVKAPAKKDPTEDKPGQNAIDDSTKAPGMNGPTIPPITLDETSRRAEDPRDENRVENGIGSSTEDLKTEDHTQRPSSSDDRNVAEDQNGERPIHNSAGSTTKAPEMPGEPKQSGPSMNMPETGGQEDEKAVQNAVPASTETSAMKAHTDQPFLPEDVNKTNNQKDDKTAENAAHDSTEKSGTKEHAEQSSSSMDLHERKDKNDENPVKSPAGISSEPPGTTEQIKTPSPPINMADTGSQGKQPLQNPIGDSTESSGSKEDTEQPEPSKKTPGAGGHMDDKQVQDAMDDSTQGIKGHAGQSMLMGSTTETADRTDEGTREDTAGNSSKKPGTEEQPSSPGDLSGVKYHNSENSMESPTGNSNEIPETEEDAGIRRPPVNMPEPVTQKNEEPVQNSMDDSTKATEMKGQMNQTTPLVSRTQATDQTDEKPAENGISDPTEEPGIEDQTEQPNSPVDLNEAKDHSSENVPESPAGTFNKVPEAQEHTEKGNKPESVNQKDETGTPNTDGEPTDALISKEDRKQPRPSDKDPEAAGETGEKPVQNAAGDSTEVSEMKEHTMQPMLPDDTTPKSEDPKDNTAENLVDTSTANPKPEEHIEPPSSSTDQSVAGDQNDEKTMKSGEDNKTDAPETADQSKQPSIPTDMLESEDQENGKPGQSAVGDSSKAPGMEEGIGQSIPLGNTTKADHSQDEKTVEEAIRDSTEEPATKEHHDQPKFPANHNTTEDKHGSNPMNSEAGNSAEAPGTTEQTTQTALPMNMDTEITKNEKSSPNVTGGSTEAPGPKERTEQPTLPDNMTNKAENQRQNDRVQRPGSSTQGPVTEENMEQPSSSADQNEVTEQNGEEPTKNSSTEAPGRAGQANQPPPLVNMAESGDQKNEKSGQDATANSTDATVPTAMSQNNTKLVDMVGKSTEEPGTNEHTEQPSSLLNPNGDRSQNGGNLMTTPASKSTAEGIEEQPKKPNPAVDDQKAEGQMDQKPVQNEMDHSTEQSEKGEPTTQSSPPSNTAEPGGDKNAETDPSNTVDSDKPLQHPTDNSSRPGAMDHASPWNKMTEVGSDKDEKPAQNTIDGSTEALVPDEYTEHSSTPKVQSQEDNVHNQAGSSSMRPPHTEHTTHENATVAPTTERGNPLVNAILNAPEYILEPFRLLNKYGSGLLHKSEKKARSVICN